MTTYTITTADEGWYDSFGNHTTSNENTLTGEYNAREYRSFFTFNLAGITGIVQSVTFRIQLEWYNSPDASESLNFHQVLGSPHLGAGGVAAFNDLGDGPIYANLTLTPSGTGSVYSLTLSAQAIQDIQNNLGGIFTIGADLSTHAAPDNGEWVRFGFGSVSEAISELIVVSFSNVIDGTSGDDFLNGTADSDQINGYDGNDTLRGNDGDDELNGGNGNDHLRGGRGIDTFNGGADDGEGFNGIGDRISFYEQAATQGAVADLRTGVISNDGFGNAETMTGIESLGAGTAFADTFYGDDGRNYLFADIGDTVHGFGGDDIVQTASAAALIDGGADTDRLILLTSGGWFIPDADADGLAEVAGAATSGWTVDLAAGTMTDGYGNVGSVAGIENVDGSVLGDSITGDGNANVLNGGDGDDTLEGAGGSDTLDGGEGSDTVTYANAAGPVEVNLQFGFADKYNPDETAILGTDTLSGIENAIGSEFNDALIGDDNANVLHGLGGNDFIQARGGDDILYGGDGNDTLQGELNENNISVSGNDILYGENGNDGLRGGLGDDQLYGGANNDLLRGNGGVDYFDGGSDDGEGFNGIGDRVSFYEQRATQGAVADLRTGIIANDGFGNAETMVGIESLGGGTAFADTFYGDDGRNFLFADIGDTVQGFGGDDIVQAASAAALVDGGADIDRLILLTSGGWFMPDANADGLAEIAGEASSGWTVDLAAGTLVDGYGAVGTVAGFENVDGSVLGDSITGDASDNVLKGGDGDDMLEGGLGNDTIDGGNGTDTASYANAAGGVSVDLGGGVAFGADGNDTLANIENVIGSEFADNLTGDGGGNVLEGLGGNDFMSGGAGDDTLYGGDGDDFLQGDFGENNITVTGNDVMYGGNGNDQLRSGLGDDQLYGGANNDLLRGNGGVDYFDGGSDDGEGINGIGDRVSFFEQRATQGVIADLRTGVISNDGFGNVEFMVNIESLGADTAFVDTLYGNDGRNFLAGNQGDFLYGFGADDIFQLISAAAVVDGGDGVDRLNVFISTFGLLLPDSDGDGLAEIAPEATAGWSIDLAAGTLVDGYGYVGTVAGIENVNGTILADTIIGDANANVLNGGDGDDTLEGRGGNDTLDGGDGNDTASYANALGAVQLYLYGGGYGEAYGADGYDQLHGIENLTGGAFNDWVFGDDADNVLAGGDGHDSLRGYGGNDTLLGEGGDDFLNGGLGDDLIDGGAGWDRAAFYDGATVGVTVNLNLQGVAQDTGQGWDTLVNIENVSGTVFGDTLIGDDGDNVLWGSASTISPGDIATTNNDTLSGGGGNDLLWVGIGNHVVDGGDGIDTFRFNENGAAETGIVLSLLLQGAAQASGNGDWTLTNIENLSGSIADDSLTGDGNDNVLAGDAGNDNLSGGEGNDTLYGDGQINWDTHGVGGSGPIVTTADTGAGGNDVLEGGFGNDSLDGGAGTDTATYANASGGVTVNLGGGFAFGADGNDTLVNIENAVGSEFADDLTGDGGSNVLYGLGGNDFMSGGAGDDTLYGGDGDDFLQGDFGENNITVTGNDVLYGGNGTDNLRGGLGDDQLYGGANNDLLRGNGGVDHFDGGSDDAEGVNGIGDRVSFYERRATQGVVADLRTGVIANDGFGNVETMVGIESLGAGTAYADTFHGNDDRNFLWLSLGDSVYGHGGDDILLIDAAAAIADGGAGIDVLQLGLGGSLLLPDADADGLAEIAVAATAGWTVDLAAGTLVDGYGNAGSVTGIENVDGSTLGDTIIGDGNANVLKGFDGDDTLNGGAGDDMLDGGNGTDTASYANAANWVSVDLRTGFASGGDGNDTLVSIENLIGSAFSDGLLGNDGNNVIAGGDGHDYMRAFGGDDTLLGEAGDDYLNGGDGDDLLDGGAGWDRVAYLGAAAGVTVDLNIQGVAQNTGSQGFDTLVGIEHVSGTIYNDVITGNGGDNWLWGGSDGSGVTGNDVISAGGGNDLVEVGAGTHTLSGGAGIDTLSLWGNGTDIGAAGVTFSLALQGAAQNSEQGMINASGFENLSGSNHDDFLTGDNTANILLGDLGHDTLRGNDGDDFLYGDGRMGVDSHGVGTSGPITLYGDAAALTDVAGGNDTMLGGRGNDWLYGGRGNDVMTGNQGNDRFVIETSSGDDRVTDFAVGIDKVVFQAVSGIDSFSDLTIVKVGNNTVISWGTSDSLQLDGVKPNQLAASDFDFII